jgi:thiamine-monophosphate kinase
VIDPETPVAEIGEREFLRYLQARIPSGDGVVTGVGDDAALVETAAQTLVTTDSLVERVHFRREWSPPRLLGRKALSVNLSDIAAMAGIPRHAVVSLCLPPDTSMRFLEGLYDGLLERAAETGVNVVGGNLSSSGSTLVIDVTVLGYGRRILRRSTARAGDLVVVTGTLGAAAAGLIALGQGARLNSDGDLESTGVWTQSSAPSIRHCLRAQLDPTPPLAFARALSDSEFCNAAIDISDGLSGDLRSVCEASGLSARVDESAVPLDAHAVGLERARGGDALALGLHGGEDYQLLLAVPPESLDGLKDLAVFWDLPLSVLGAFAEGPPEVTLKTGNEIAPLPPAAHEHFRMPASARGSDRGGRP